MPLSENVHAEFPPGDVLAAWAVSREAERQAIEPLGDAGGFSGARFWRIETPQGTYCLRRWPREHPDRRRLAWIHAVLRYAAQHGFDRLPLPVSSEQGTTFIERLGSFWQLEPWLAGRADDQAVSDVRRVAAAMRTLAEFHQAVAAFPTDRSQGTSASATGRKRRLEWLIDGGLEQLRGGLRSAPWEAFRQRAEEIVALFPVVVAGLRSLLREAASCVVPLQPCIRDIWREHVLFEGERVVGLVDFGAMRVDNVACDVARLLGSMARGDKQLWQAGLTAYEALRPLRGDERRLVVAMERSTTAMGGLQWVEWCCLEQRHFSNMDKVVARLDEFLLCMRRAADVSDSLWCP